MKHKGLPRQYPRGPGPMSGLPPAQAALALVASGGVERQDQGGRRMNNIGGANVVILKRPTVEEADNNLENHTYPITAATQSQNLARTKISGLKIFQPTSQVTRPATRNTERPLAQQASRNLEQLDGRTAWSPSRSPPLTEVDDIEDSTIVIGGRYGMSGALPPSQEKRVQFEEEDDGVYDIPEPRHYQKETLPPTRPQEAAKNQDNWSATKETIPIKMAEGKEHFQVGSFLETPVTLPIWQRLDLSPQLKVQLAQAIASSWFIKRGKKSAGPNLLGTAAVAAKFWTLPAIAHKDKEGYDQLLLKRWTYKVLDRGPGAKTIWGRSIPEILPSVNGRLVRLHGFTPAEIMLGFVPDWKVTRGNAQEVMPDITHGTMREATPGEVEEIEAGPKGLRIERMIDRREEQRILPVRSISENHTRQEGIMRAQWTQPRVGDLVLVRDFERDKHHVRKLDARWIGPRILTEITSSGVSGFVQELLYLYFPTSLEKRIEQLSPQSPNPTLSVSSSTLIFPKMQ